MRIGAGCPLQPLPLPLAARLDVRDNKESERVSPSPTSSRCNPAALPAKQQWICRPRALMSIVRLGRRAGALSAGRPAGRCFGAASDQWPARYSCQFPCWAVRKSWPKSNSCARAGRHCWRQQRRYGCAAAAAAKASAAAAAAASQAGATAAAAPPALSGPLQAPGCSRCGPAK